MELNGRASVLPNDLFEALKEAEVCAVNAGSRLIHLAGEVALPHIRSLMGEHVRSPTSSLSGRSYRSVRVIDIILEPVAFRASTFDSQLGLGIETALERSRTHTLYAYPETVVEGTIEELVAAVADCADLKALSEVKTEVVSARAKLAEACSLLKARIREPHPLYESIDETIGDIVAAFRPRVQKL